MKEAIIALVLGTATPGGGFPVFGDAFAEMVNAQEPALRIQTRNTKLRMEYPNLVYQAISD